MLLRRRAAEGLLGGMTELPGTEWSVSPLSPEELLVSAPMQAGWRNAGEVRQVFTHFELRLTVFSATIEKFAADGFVHPALELDQAALPSVMRKCVVMAQAGMAQTKKPGLLRPPQNSIL